MLDYLPSVCSDRGHGIHVSRPYPFASTPPGHSLHHPRPRLTPSEGPVSQSSSHPTYFSPYTPRLSPSLPWCPVSCVRESCRTHRRVSVSRDLRRLPVPTYTSLDADLSTRSWSFGTPLRPQTGTPLPLVPSRNLSFRSPRTKTEDSFRPRRRLRDQNFPFPAFAPVPQSSDEVPIPSLLPLPSPPFLSHVPVAPHDSSSHPGPSYPPPQSPLDTVKDPTVAIPTLDSLDTPTPPSIEELPFTPSSNPPVTLPADVATVYVPPNTRPSEVPDGVGSSTGKGPTDVGTTSVCSRTGGTGWNPV